MKCVTGVSPAALSPLLCPNVQPFRASTNDGHKNPTGVHHTGGAQVGDAADQAADGRH